jgi:hypothetical protein
MNDVIKWQSMLFLGKVKIHKACKPFFVAGKYHFYNINTFHSSHTYKTDDTKTRMLRKKDQNAWQIIFVFYKRGIHTIVWQKG